MKVLISTQQTQGIRHSDFSWTKEGELVRLGIECDSDKNRIDDGCGCRRSMVGLATSKATTTFKVIDKDITDDKFFKLVCKSYEREEVLKILTDEEIKAYVAELKEFADAFPIDVVLEKRGDKIQVRKNKPK